MSYDQWLEAPYQRRASLEEAQEQMSEDLWNDHELAEAIQAVSDALSPVRGTKGNTPYDRYVQLIEELAEHLIDNAEEVS